MHKSQTTYLKIGLFLLVGLLITVIIAITYHFAVLANEDLSTVPTIAVFSTPTREILFGDVGNAVDNPIAPPYSVSNQIMLRDLIAHCDAFYLKHDEYSFTNEGARGRTDCDIMWTSINIIYRNDLVTCYTLYGMETARARYWIHQCLIDRFVTIGDLEGIPLTHDYLNR
jgi:hypothetical protein